MYYYITGTLILYHAIFSRQLIVFNSTAYRFLWPIVRQEVKKNRAFNKR